MALGIDPTVDYAFKRLFGDPSHSSVLIHLLNAIFEGYFRVAGVEILTPFLEKDFDDDKLGVLDLRVRDTTGRNYNLEMQSALAAGLPNRLTYYLSSMYSDQLREGDPYTSLSPAYCVCFLKQSILPATSSFHTRFRLSSLEERLVLTDHLEIHLVELPKYNGQLADLPTSTSKERWAYFLRHAAEMSVSDIGQVFREPAFVEAGGVLDMISKTEEERYRYEMRTKAQRDYMSGIVAAREEGRAEGQWQGRIQILQEILGEPVLATEELASWDVDRLQKMAETLQSRLRDRR